MTRSRKRRMVEDGGFRIVQHGKEVRGGMKRRKLNVRGQAQDDGEVEVVKMVNRKLGVVIQRREESGARIESDQSGSEVERIQYRWVRVYHDDDGHLVL